MKIYNIIRVAAVSADQSMDVEHTSIQFSTVSKESAVSFLEDAKKKFLGMENNAIKKYFGLSAECKIKELEVRTWAADSALKVGTVYDPFLGEDVECPENYSENLMGFEVLAFDQETNCVDKYSLEAVDVNIPSNYNIAEHISNIERRSICDSVKNENMTEDVFSKINEDYEENPLAMHALNDKSALAKIVYKANKTIERNDSYWESFWLSIAYSIDEFLIEYPNGFDNSFI